MLFQLVGSAVAIAALVGIAAWAGIARPTPPLDGPALKALLDVEFPDHHPTATWISADGSGALAREGETVLVVWRRGDGFVGRDAPLATIAQARSINGRVALKLGDARPVFAVADDVWPPKGLTA